MLPEIISHSSALPTLASNDWGATSPPNARLTGLGGRSQYIVPKTIIDVVHASVLLVLTSPVILVVMLLVKLTSRGPALYTQTRLGHNGRPFTIYKIRTMRHNCEQLTGPQWAAERDPRATPLGQFLRRTHLDELPQLWNVIRGEMSLVGPRPERPEFAYQLERAIPEYWDRMRVRPGVTGLAQVQLPPDSDLAGVRRKVACDLLYLERMGPALDAKILLATIAKIVGIPAAVTVRLLRLPAAPKVDGPACDEPADRAVAASSPTG